MGTPSNHDPAKDTPGIAPHPTSQMLNPYLYDVSSTLPDRLLQPKSETAAERMARLAKAVDAAFVVLKGKDDNVGHS